MNRRDFLSYAARGVALGLTLSTPMVSSGDAGARIKAVAFDAFPVFDPRPIFRLAGSLFPEKGEELAKVWFAKIFGYTWLRTLGGQYQDFGKTTAGALEFAARSTGAALTPEARRELLSAWTKLKAWPDVEPALEELQVRGIRMCFLSNMSEEMLRTNARNAGIENAFEHFLSTDRVRAFKPDPRAYQMGVDVLELPPENIAFAAFAGWDAAGASWFGYPTVWVNRLGSPAEELGDRPAATGRDMTSLLKLVGR